MPLNSGETPTAAIESFIQTGAVINRGNSGGALANTKGELVGINTAIISHTGSYEGYGFAVPVNIVKKVIDDLLRSEEHTSELQSLMRISYAVFCLKKKKRIISNNN